MDIIREEINWNKASIVVIENSFRIILCTKIFKHQFLMVGQNLYRRFKVCIEINYPAISAHPNDGQPIDGDESKMIMCIDKDQCVDYEV